MHALLQIQPPLFRVHEATAGHYSEVQVRPGGVAGAADLSYILPARNLLPALYIDLAEMAVKRLDVAAVIDDYALPVAPFTPASVTVPDSHASTLVPVENPISIP